jgi:hypothetical protein
MKRYYAGMNSRHTRTLVAVFTDPVPAAIAWDDVEGLLLAAGCKLVEGAGSRVRFECNGLVASFHRPHPAKEAKRYQVRDAREFLTKLGVNP